MTSSAKPPADLELAAREYAVEVLTKFPLASHAEMLVLAFMQGSIHGMDVIRAAHATGEALAMAAKK